MVPPADSAWDGDQAREDQKSQLMRLFSACRYGDLKSVKSLLQLFSIKDASVDQVDDDRGWTPLIAACVGGHLPVVQCLLGAGVCPGRCDIAGWTEIEHAAQRGHMDVVGALLSALKRLHAHSLEANHAADSIVRLGDRLTCSVRGEASVAAPLRAPMIVPNEFDIKKEASHIFLAIGPSNCRSNIEPISFRYSDPNDESYKSRLRIEVKAYGAVIKSKSFLVLPSWKDMIYRPMHLTTADPGNVVLQFNVYETFESIDKPPRLIGSAIAISSALSGNDFIGTLTFNFLTVTPALGFPAPSAKSSGCWKPGAYTQVVGHRGFGAISTARTHLQIGENTIQSFLSAAKLGTSCVEFDVQLTKDNRTVIFHDFIAQETGANVLLHTLTLDQFMHLNRSQAPKSNVVDRAEARFLRSIQDDKSQTSRKHSSSLNEYDESGPHNLTSRMCFTEEGLSGKIKGDLRGYSIQEPASTLEQLLTELSEDLPFNLEIKYPMLWEAEDRDMEPYAMEINFFVDKILAVIFKLCGNRNITLSSFSPEICILLKCKQDSFPILFINKAGSQPAGDVRAGSLQGAIEFAKAWNLPGIVMLSDPFVLCPRLLTYAKESGLIVGSYGDFNDNPATALIQAEAGLDIIMTNKIKLIAEALRPKGSALNLEV